MAPLRVVFTTLFLGIVSGPQLVEVGVEGTPARIELRLDGAPFASLLAPPWQATVDFGAEPRPHELSATAFDASGAPVTSERQFVNLARPPAEVQLIIERDGAGRAHAARVAWGNLAGRTRPQISMRLDGRTLAVDATGRTVLPPGLSGPGTGPGHVLSAELRFSPAVTARRDRMLGGELSEEVSTEATALPLLAPSGLTAPADLAGSITSGGRPLPVVAIEDGPAQVLLVRGLSGALGTRRLGAVARRPSKFSTSFGAGSSNNRFDFGDVAHGRFDYGLAKEDRIRILWPVATRSPGASLPTRLFDATPDFESKDGGLLWLLTSVYHPDPGADRDRFADAVTVAGLQAMAAGRRRAVILVLGEEAVDRSSYLPAQARAYLETLRVPLFVWSIAARPSPLAREWGAVDDVSSPAQLRRAVARLRATLEAQRIVWVPGLHLPAAVELTPAARARGLGWAGEGAPTLP